MLPIYQVRVRNHAGQIVNVFAGAGKVNDSLVNIQCSMPLDQIGTHAITFQGNVDVFDAWLPDYQIEVWRRPSGEAWRKAYHGFHRTYEWQDSAKGEQFISYGHDLKGLLARATIAAYTTTPEALKTGPAETVAKRYVYENIGPGATQIGDVRARLGVTVEADQGRGPAWTGDSARESLYDVVRAVLVPNGLDFDFVSETPNSFDFRVYYPQIGVDRSIGNAGGLKPIIFSRERNSMVDPRLSINHGSDANVVYVLGQGEGLARQVVEVVNPTELAISPWNRIELSRQANNDGTLAGLVSTGMQVLYDGRSVTSLSFGVAQAFKAVYGVDYFEGDIVTGIYHQSINKRIVNVILNVANKGEQVSLEIGDVI